MKRAAATFLVPAVVAFAVTAAGDDRAAERRAEVQVGLCSEPDKIIPALGLEPAAAERLEVWYFDDPSLGFFGHGLLFRLRIKDRQSELTLKVAHQDCAQVPPTLIPYHEGKCEYDLHGTEMTGAVSLNKALDDRTREELVAGRVPLSQVLSAAQIRYLQEVAHAWPLASGLERLGPAHVDSYRNPNRSLVVEVWHLPSGRRFIEISQRVSLEEARRTRAQLEKTLVKTGVRACANQSSQARAKLQDLLATKARNGSD
jgi:hypothetical protein